MKMLIQMSNKDRSKSLYECDRCNKKCSLNEKKGIYIENELGRPVKEWDLCLRCYKALKMGIKKGQESQNEKRDQCNN